MARTPIRAKDFRSFMLANFRKSELRDVATHGADAGWQWLTWTADTVRLFDRYGEEIWDWAVDDAADYGCANVLEMVAGFGRADMADTLDGFKNLMVWYAAERVARELTDN